MEWIIGHWQEIALAITGVISAASAIAAITPSPKDDAFWAKLARIVDVFALNVGHAKEPVGMTSVFDLDNSGEIGPEDDLSNLK